MPLQEALSRCKGAVLIEADEAYYHRMFDRIVEALLQRGPLVEKGDLGRAFVDMHGTEAIYGGDEGMTVALLGGPFLMASVRVLGWRSPSSRHTLRRSQAK